MYDEFRIKSMKVKIMPMQTTNLPNGQLVINTAWDRNGIYKKTYFSTAGAIGECNEGIIAGGLFDINVPTYSSFQSKPLLQYQSGVMHKTIAAAGFPDNLFMPTSVSRMATSVWSGAGQYQARSNWLDDLKRGVTTEFYHSFNPTLYV